MTVDRSQLGRDSSERGHVAERTFNDMISWWLSGTNAAPSSQLIPDAHKIDWKVTIPSLWREVEDIETNWQIKATATRLPGSDKNPLGCPCFRFRMNKNDLRTLCDFSRSNQTQFLAIASQRDPSVRPADLLELPPFERFDWHVLDLKQYFQHNSPDEVSAIYVPVHNMLNLATFSLLWGAHWVRRFFLPLSTPRVLQVPDLAAHIKTAFSEKSVAEDLAKVQSWDFLTKELPKYRRDLDDHLFRQVNFRLGLGSALGIIRSLLWSAAGNLNLVRNYCPEALYGTTNLWLFSRIYRQFMETAAVIGQANPDFRNQRLLPLNADVPEDVPRILRCALWHVTICYGLLNTDVRIVMRPPVGAGDDHSHYGGGIGYFPWISLTPDQANWMVDTESAGTTHTHIDFLDQHQNNVYISLPRTIIDIAYLLKIDQNQLQLPMKCPTMLFPPEDEFLRYPHDLFSPSRYSILTGTRPITNKGKGYK